MENTYSKLIFKMTGEQFEDGKNLYYLLQGLENFQGVITKSYLNLTGKKRMTDRDREIFQIKALDFRDGSFVTEVGLYLFAFTQITLPYANSLTLNNIIDLVINGYEYLKFVIRANSKGEKIKLEFGDNGMLNVIGDHNTLIVSQDVLGYIKRAEPHFERLAQLINPEKGINNISFYDKCKQEEKKVKIGEDEKELFKEKTRLETDPVTFNAELFRIDGKDFVGKLTVTKSDDSLIKVGDIYNFKFIKKSDVNKLSNAFMKEKTIHALKETTLDTSTLEKNIKRLLIIDIE